MATSSLFGPTPAELILAQQQQSQQEQMLRNQMIAQQGAEFGPFRGLYQAGLKFGDIGTQNMKQTMFPEQIDPRLKEAVAVQSVLSKYADQDQSDPTVLARIGKDLLPIAPNAGLQAITLSKEMAVKEAALKKSALEAQKAELTYAQEIKLRDELAALGPDASEDQVLGVVTKYGSPDKIMAAISARQTRETSLAQQRDLALQRLDIARMNYDLKDQQIREKRLDKEEAKAAKLSSAMGVADNVVSVAKIALNQTGFFTAGMVGKPLSALGVPAAVDLEENLKTIQANLGFKELQAMRDASPTGGALGQVALKELEFLQAALTSLSNRQSPEQLKTNLNKVVTHYTKWRDAVSKSQESVQPQTPTGAPAAAPAQEGLPAGVTVTRKGG